MFEHCSGDEAHRGCLAVIYKGFHVEPGLDQLASRWRCIHLQCGPVSQTTSFYFQLCSSSSFDGSSRSDMFHHFSRHVLQIMGTSKNRSRKVRGHVLYTSSQMKIRVLPQERFKFSSASSELPWGAGGSRAHGGRDDPMAPRAEQRCPELLGAYQQFHIGVPVRNGGMIGVIHSLSDSEVSPLCCSWYLESFHFFQGTLGHFPPERVRSGVPTTPRASSGFVPITHRPGAAGAMERVGFGGDPPKNRLGGWAATRWKT